MKFGSYKVTSGFVIVITSVDVQTDRGTDQLSNKGLFILWYPKKVNHM